MTSKSTPNKKDGLRYRKTLPSITPQARVICPGSQDCPVRYTPRITDRVPARVFLFRLCHAPSSSDGSG